jgi:hypothetical protein
VVLAVVVEDQAVEEVVIAMASQSQCAMFAKSMTMMRCTVASISIMRTSLTRTVSVLVTLPPILLTSWIPTGIWIIAPTTISPAISIA